MKVPNQIKAIIFLGAFVVMLLHNAFPHEHHSHEEVEVVDNGSDHQHHSHQHHSEEQDSDEDNQDYSFSYLLNNHSHSLHAHKFVQLSILINPCFSGKELPNTTVLESNYVTLRYEERNRHRYSLFKDVTYNDPHLLNCSLRAPPSLG